MMPKGVEHLCVAWPTGGAERVRIPMMPKGVEHTRRLAMWLVSETGENSDDAERR